MSEICDECKEKVDEVWEHKDKYVCSDCLNNITNREAKVRKTIVAWVVEVEWDDGTIEKLPSMPEWASKVVDEWLTGVEDDRAEMEDNSD